MWLKRPFDGNGPGAVSDAARFASARRPAGGWKSEAEGERFGCGNAEVWSFCESLNSHAGLWMWGFCCDRKRQEVAVYCLGVQVEFSERLL